MKKESKSPLRRKLTVMALIMASIFILGACGRQSDRVSHNVSREADEFNVVRRVAVLNMRSDEIVFEVVGHIAIETGNEERLVILAKTDNDTYKKHYVNLNEWNMYVVEDLYGADVNNYRYEVHYTPEMIAPIEVK